MPSVPNVYMPIGTSRTPVQLKNHGTKASNASRWSTAMPPA